MLTDHSEPSPDSTVALPVSRWIGAPLVIGSAVMGAAPLGSEPVVGEQGAAVEVSQHPGCAALAGRVKRYTRARAASVRAGCERYALAAAAAVRRQRPEDRSRILCYHATGTPTWGINDLSPKRFARQIEWARREGWTFTDARSIATANRGQRSLALTFDDGLASVQQVAPLLADQGVPWTLFVVTDWMDRGQGGDEWFLSWDEVGELAARGVTIASHSVSHPNFPLVEADRAVEELVSSRELLSERLGITTDEFAIPLGQSANWNERLQREARAAGYTHVYAQAEETRTAGTIPRTFVTRWDNAFIFGSALKGTFDRWEEWV